MRCSRVTTAPLDKIPYVTYPELKFSEHESTEMPFKYVTDKDGQPIMPEVSFNNFPSRYLLCKKFHEMRTV